VSEGATYGYDSAYGEVAIPPAPVVPVFDARLVDLPGRARFPGTGGRIDIRDLHSETQLDTFLVRFQPAEGKYPVLVSWPVDIGRVFSDAIMEYEHDGEREEIVMTSVSSFMVEDDRIARLTIILSGPRTLED
jgi:hypothetical protein